VTETGKIHTIGAECTAFAFRPDVEPALRVQPGEIVRFETSAKPIEHLIAAGDRWLEILDLDAINAITGPVYIEGVEPGDAVAVEILDITPADWGWCAYIPGYGLLARRLQRPMLRRLPIRDGQIHISDRLTIPVRPSIGCLGLAPAKGQSSTLGPPYPWGGNYDLPQIRPGSTVLLPAQVPGGLFSLGDLHAAMGAHEPTFVSIECPGVATVRLRVRKGLALQTPRIETPDRLYTVGLTADDSSFGLDFNPARRQAVALMFDYLTRERGFSPEDAYILTSACVDLELGGPAGAVVLASIPLAVLT